MNLPRFPDCFKSASKPHKFCPGCGHALVLKMLGQAIDELRISHKSIFLVDIGCSLLAWDYFDLPTAQTHHGRTIPTAVGFKKADPQKTVIAYLGDGGGYAIGLQHTITACLRQDPITTILVNNTLYAMTGGQIAPTSINQPANTLLGPETLSHLPGNKYLARGSCDKPLVLKEYLKKALLAQEKGEFAFVEALAYCPTNWKTDALGSIAKIKELEKTFPLGEIK